MSPHTATNSNTRAQGKMFSKRRPNRLEDDVPRRNAELKPRHHLSRRLGSGFHLKTTMKEKLYGDAPMGRTMLIGIVVTSVGKSDRPFVRNFLTTLITC
jgi:hypothetical protein